MTRRLALVGCLAFSGLAALVYQVVWTRLLGFAFGTSTEAIGTVLAIFFAGLALGNLLAARGLARARRPLLVYALLEAGIGAFALASLPALQRLPAVYAAAGADRGPAVAVLLRVALATALLLPPTLAMGATLPLVARGLVAEDRTLGRWSALLYTANTFGAVLGAYACGFWLIPGIGLARTVLAAAAANGVVAVAALALARGLRAPALPEPTPAAVATGGRRGRGWFLLFFAVSGFVAIGYEIVWSKVFSIVMEGTLYGITAVLAADLLGLALGSLAIARRVDAIRDLPRAFGLLHVAIAATVALGITAVPWLPLGLHVLARLLRGGDAVQVLLLLAAPLVVVPTALFGAAFPVLIRIYTSRAARAGEGIGVATAVNTAGSIAASGIVSFWAVPALGVDGSLYALLLLDLGVALLVLLRFQTSAGRERLAATGVATAVLMLIALGYDGVRVERAVVGRWLGADTLAEYRAGVDRVSNQIERVLEGRSSIVTVHKNASGRVLRTNGLPEASHSFAAPYFSLETQLLGVLPYLLADEPRRALVIGFGGGATVDALLETQIAEVSVVELEPRVIEAAQLLYGGGPTPLHDPRVHLRIDDGRNALLLARARGGPRYDVIASQPSHPWVAGAANLFTEEYFALARENLSEGGVFAAWVNGVRTDPESALAILTSFERVFPGALVVAGGGATPRESLILLGARQPLRVDTQRAARRLREPAVAASLALQQVDSLESLLARCEGRIADFARIEPGAANTDDNAFVETRVPRRLAWSALDFGSIERRLAPDAPVLPPSTAPVDVAAVARGVLALGPAGAGWPFAAKLDRLLRVHGRDVDPVAAASLRAEAALHDPAAEAAALVSLRELAARAPDRAEPLRAIGRHLAEQRRDYQAAAGAFEQAFARSGDPSDAFDAARAWHAVDRSRAYAWSDRIPPEARSRFARLASYDAERALAERAPVAELRERYAALLAYRDTPEGRRSPEIEALAAALADALGDAGAARAHRDADRRAREERAAPLIARAERALDQGDLASAADALGAASGLVPGEPRVLEANARLALARRDPAALAQALAELRSWAPSLIEAVAQENRWRQRVGLALLSEHDALEIARGGQLAAGRESAAAPPPGPRTVPAGG